MLTVLKAPDSCYFNEQVMEHRQCSSLVRGQLILKIYNPLYSLMVPLFWNLKVKAVKNNLIFMTRKEHTIDATDIPVGRLASKIALLLRGKNKPNFTPHLDQGDSVVIENINKIKITGNKLNNKIPFLCYSFKNMKASSKPCKMFNLP